MEDRYLWATETARAVRAGDLARVDTERLAEELDQVGRSDKRELTSLLQRVVEHLLKVDYIGGLDVPHWLGEITALRYQAEDLLEESPSLRGHLTPELAEKTYNRALDKLRLEYGGERFEEAPKQCPYPLDQVIGKRRR